MDDEGPVSGFDPPPPVQDAEDDVETTTEWNWPFIAGAGAILVILVGTAAFFLLRDSEEDQPPPTSSTTTTETVPLSADFTVAALLPLDGQYAQVLALAESSGALAELDGVEEVTLLAPNTEAFSEAGIDPETTDPEAADQVVRRHILRGTVTMSDLLELDGGTVTTIDGDELPVSVDGTTVTIGGATIAKSNITADNGVIHVVTAVVGA